MRSAGVHGQGLPIRADSTQAADPTSGRGSWRRWTQLPSRSQNHLLPHISPKLSGGARWRSFADQQPKVESLKARETASQPLSSFCPEVLDLDFSIWDKYTSSDAALAVPERGWFLLRGYADLDESFSHSLRSISTESSFTGEDSEGKTKIWFAWTPPLWDI